MTNHEAYVFGWVYGRLEAAMGGYKRDISLAAMRPYSASAQIINEATRRGALRGDLEREIAEAMTHIDAIEAPTNGYQEAVQPLPLQGSWQLGYTRGAARKDLEKQG